MLDTATIRPQFPILETSVHGKPLIYLDNAATCLLYTSDAADEL